MVYFFEEFVGERSHGKMVHFEYRLVAKLTLSMA